MTGWRTAVAVLAACALGAPCSGYAANFAKEFRGPARLLGRAFADTVARTVPVTSASPGITFSFDPTSGGFTRDSELLGQLYLERARPIGQGKWNLSASYQRVHIDSIEGQGVDDLHDNGEAILVVSRPRQQDPPLPRSVVPIKYDRYDIDLTVNEVILATTYGITNDLDVSLMLPILVSSLGIDVKGNAFTVDPNNNGKLVQTSPRLVKDMLQDTSSSATGVGDLLLRGKYRFLQRGWGEVAAGLMVRMPTGNQDNFQGTGTWELSPLLYANSRRIELARQVALQLYANGGIDLNIDDVDLSQARFGIGADLALASAATFSIAFLGREAFHGFAPTGFFDVPRYRPAERTCVSGTNTSRCPTAPLFGLETDRPSYYSLSVGGRVNLWRNTVFGFANVLIPLTDQGIRTAPIPLVGFEATF